MFGGGGRGHPSGQEQKRQAQEGKTLHPVEPRPSLLPTGRAAEPPVKQPFGQSVLRCDRGQTKDTRARQHLSQSVSQTPDTERCSHRSLPPFSGYKRTFFVLSPPAVGLACLATISAISVIASKHKRACVPLEQRAGPSLCLSSIIITLESQSLTSVQCPLMSFNNEYSRSEGISRILKDLKKKIDFEHSGNTFRTSASCI